jgi:simple sugar transport system ATP-binding protein
MTLTDNGMLLEAVDVHKRFGTVTALSGVSFGLRPGEVLALLGDNGAGKSTLIKILSGVHVPDDGTLAWEGVPITIGSPRAALDLGISVVYQDLALVDMLSIYRNVFLGREDAVMTRRAGVPLLDVKRARQEAIRCLAALGVNMASVDTKVRDLSRGERQAIAIARAVYFQSKLLILDEPTSALSLKESRRVMEYVVSASKAGVAVILITHNVHSIHAIADKIVVLTRGSVVGSFARESGGIPDVDEISRLIDEELARPDDNAIRRV